jgi:hypothetical protein
MFQSENESPLGAVVSQHRLAASSGADLVQVKCPVRTQDDVIASDDVAANDLQSLGLQAITREQARWATKGISCNVVNESVDSVPCEGSVPNENIPTKNIFTDDFIELIRKHQEQDPFCMSAVPALAATGSVVDNCPALTGGILGLLCVARRVIVSQQTTLRS